MDRKPYTPPVLREAGRIADFPAFPSNYRHEHPDGSVSYREWAGMSLLDYFAAKAASGSAARSLCNGLSADTVADRALEIAKSMMRKRPT